MPRFAAPSRRPARWALTLLALTAFSVFATWPLITHMDQFLFVTDPMLYSWGLWWVPHALFHFENPWWSTYVIAPDGAYLSFHALVPLAGVVMAPVTALFGAPMSYNVLKLLLPVVATCTARGAARQFGLAGWSAWLAGSLYGFSTIVMWRTTFHLNFGFGLALLPLTLLWCAKFAQERRTRDAALTGVAVGLLILTDPTMAFLGGLTVGSYVAVEFARAREWKLWGRLVVVASGAGLLVGLPQLAMMVRAASNGGYEPNLEALATNWVTANTSLRTMLSPANVRPYVPGNLEGWVFKTSYGEAIPAFGWAALGLAFAGIVVLLFTRGRARPTVPGALLWAGLLWVAAVILAMGPELRIWNGEHVPFPVHRHGQTLSGLMPYTWLTTLPGFADVRIPARFVMLGMLPLAILAGAGAQMLVARSRVIGTALVAVAVVWGVLESGMRDGGAGGKWVPMKLERLYAPVKADRSESIVVDVPLGFLGATAGAGTSRQEEGMMRATEHHHPVAGAFLARLTQTEVDHVLKNRLYADLLALQIAPPAGPADPPVDPVASRASAVKMNAEWVVVWPEAARRVLPFLEQSGYRKVLDDNGVLLYRLD